MFKLALLVIALVLIAAIACYVCFRIACIRSRDTDKTVASLASDSFLKPYEKELSDGAKYYDELKKEQICITSFDGLNLIADYTEKDNCDKILILMHGYRSSAKNDFSAGLKFYRELGFNILMPDQRAHGRSDGRYITFGTFEKHDCLAWIREMSARFPNKKIYLAGLSMGATTVLLTSCMELPAAVTAVIADCGFCCGYDEVKITAKRINSHIPSFAVDIVNFMCRIFGGFDLRDDNTQLSLKHSKIPTLFIHGTRDMFVPCEMTLRNFDACRAPKELLTVPGATHGMSFLTDKTAYTETVKEFLEKYDYEL